MAQRLTDDCVSQWVNVLIVLKSESLNLLEPPEPVQACNGIALPLQFLQFPFLLLQ